MTTLTEEGHYLTDELVRNENVLDEDEVYEEENMTDWIKWMPDPVDADPCKFIHLRLLIHNLHTIVLCFMFLAKSSKRFRNSDTVSMLVDIYGTRELFVNEYRALLADRLLTQFMDNIGDEIRYLELLKLRCLLIFLNQIYSIKMVTEK